VIEKLKQILKYKTTEFFTNKLDYQFDIIGDIHGYSSVLTKLLILLGYRNEKGIWKHNDRKAIFVGDFVNRGPDSKGVMKIIRNMVENGYGYTVLGNHELNIIGYFTLNKKNQPYYQAPPSNKAQMEHIRNQFINNGDELNSYLKWLKTLPLFLDFGEFRVVHAYWSNKNIKLIKENIKDNKLTKKLIKDIFKGKSDFAKAVWQTTKGVELRLPNDLIIKDNKNIRRNKFRIAWWKSPYRQTFRNLSYENRFTLPNYTIPDQILFPYEIYKADCPPVFFGHYCSRPSLLIPSSNICCTDACVAARGVLAAYRWKGENTIKKENFIFVHRK